MNEERKQSIGEFERRGVQKDIEYNAGEDIIQQYADLDLEGMKRACVNWINTAAMHSRNENYWRERCLKAEREQSRILGYAIYLADSLEMEQDMAALLEMDAYMQVRRLVAEQATSAPKRSLGPEAEA